MKKKVLSYSIASALILSLSSISNAQTNPDPRGFSIIASDILRLVKSGSRAPLEVRTLATTHLDNLFNKSNNKTEDCILDGSIETTISRAGNSQKGVNQGDIVRSDHNNCDKGIINDGFEQLTIVERKGKVKRNLDGNKDYSLRVMYERDINESFSFDPPGAEPRNEKITADILRSSQNNGDLKYSAINIDTLYENQTIDSAHPFSNLINSSLAIPATYTPVLAFTKGNNGINYPIFAVEEITEENGSERPNETYSWTIHRDEIEADRFDIITKSNTPFSTKEIARSNFAAQGNWEVTISNGVNNIFTLHVEALNFDGDITISFDRDSDGTIELSQTLNYLYFERLHRIHREFLKDFYDNK